MQTSIMKKIVVGALLLGLFCGGAVELLGYDAMTEIQRVLAPDGKDHDHLGSHLAMADDVLVVAAVGYADPQGPFWGNVYIFRKDPINGEWKPEQTLTPPSGDPMDRFGSYVATDGEIIVVGAPFADEQGRDSGAVYVYRYNLSWQLEDTLIPNDLTELDYYGSMLTIDSNIIVVGHRSDDDLGYNAGAAYVFRYQSGQWIEEQKLLASDGEPEDRFGWGLSKFGDTIIVGAYYEDTPVVDAGSVYVFRYDPYLPQNPWVENQKLHSSEGGIDDLFGDSISLYGEWLFIGAPRHESSPGIKSGAVYVYKWDVIDEEFKKHQKLLSEGVQDGDRLGRWVSVYGEKAGISAIRCDIQGFDSGAGYLLTYDHILDEWVIESMILGADGKAEDVNGSGITLYEDTVVMGANRNDNENGLDAGAVYVYELDYDFTLSLFPTVAPAGGFCTFTTKGAQSYTDTWLVYGVKGLAYTYYQPLSVMMRLKGPEAGHGPYYTNINGHVEWTLAIPSLPPTPVWFQVIQPGQASNAVATKIE